MATDVRILVTGGTGFVGQHLAWALLRAGHHVRLMGRSFGTSQPLLDAGAERCAADLRDTQAVRAACAGMDAVCHVGALSAPWGRWEDFYHANVFGTVNVVEGCLGTGVRRLVVVSSPSVMFDGRDHVEVDESAPQPERFTSYYAATKSASEWIVRDAFRLRGLPAVILRPKAIFGPGDTTLVPRLLAAAHRGRLPQIGDGTNRVDLTYVDNVVHALLLALESDAALGKTYLITNGEHPRLWDVIRRLLASQGLTAPLRPVSLRAVLIAARLMELRARMTGREPLLTTYSAAILGRTQTYRIDAARRDLGYEPVVTLEDGIQRTIAALGEGHR